MAVESFHQKISANIAYGIVRLEELVKEAKNAWKYMLPENHIAT